MSAPAVGKVTELLLARIRKQVKEHGIVVRDSAGCYADMVSGLALPDTHIVRFDDGFFLNAVYL